VHPLSLSRRAGRFEVDITVIRPRRSATPHRSTTSSSSGCRNGRIFAVTFPAPEEAKVYELVNLDVYHQDE
jgi:hypothetical protein